MMHGNPKDETNDLFSCETINPPTPETIFSQIFVKNSPTVPLGSWNSNPLEFLRYLCSLLKILNMAFF